MLLYSKDNVFVPFSSRLRPFRTRLGTLDARGTPSVTIERGQDGYDQNYDGRS
jgi:hypothetical protein